MTRDYDLDNAQMLADANQFYDSDAAQVWHDTNHPGERARCGAYAGEPMVNDPLGCGLPESHDGDHGPAL